MLLKRFTLLTLVLMVLPSSAGAVDLTGTWVGRFNCFFNFGYKGSSVDKGQVLNITQVGTNISVDWTYTDSQSNIKTNRFTGTVINSVTKPDYKAQIAIADCRTNSDLTANYTEIANLSAQVNPFNDAGVLKGRSIYSVPPTDPPTEVGECRWFFKRVSTTNPNVGNCPAPP